MIQISKRNRDFLLAARCKRLLQEYYGRKLKGLVLYGSVARGSATKESDIDLLVLLDKKFQYGKELDIVVDLLHPLQLESTKLISAKPTLWKDFIEGECLLYRNAKEEGIEL